MTRAARGRPSLSLFYPKARTMTETSPTTIAAATLATVTLDHPFERGDATIDSVQVRCPKAGELRGLNIADLVQMNVDATAKLLPRITVPALTPQEVNQLAPSDFTQLGMEVQDFLVPKAAKATAYPAA